MLSLMIMGLCNCAGLSSYMLRLEPLNEVRAEAPSAAPAPNPRVALPTSFALPELGRAGSRTRALAASPIDQVAAGRALAFASVPTADLPEPDPEVLAWNADPLELLYGDTPAALAPLPRAEAAPPAAPSAVVEHAGREIRRAEDGLFYVDAQVNGATIRFLVDTGSTVVVLTADDAARAGVPPQLARFDATAQTAAGQTQMARITLDEIKVADTRVERIEAAVVRRDLAVSLLGQSWLAKLGSVTIAGDRMLIN